MNDFPQTDSLPPNWNGANVLCEFVLAGTQCWVVEDGVAATLLASSAFTEIRRFETGSRSLVILQRVESTAACDSLMRLLTARELQIATLVAMGCPNKQVADRLHISEWTVATYLRRIFAKLGVDSRAAMTFRCASLISQQQMRLTVSG